MQLGMLRGPLQLTLALIKPDVTKVPAVLQAVHSTIQEEQFFVIKHTQVWLTRQQAERFYAEHISKFFYNRLVTFMCSGPTAALILGHEEAIAKWRTLLGPAKVYKTQYEAADTLRGKFGLSDTRNVAHGSDSPENARKEIEFFFPEFNLIEWFASEHDKFCKGPVQFNEDKFLHSLPKNS